MSITSMTFLFLFLPIALVLYYLSDSRAKEAALLMISLVFYAVGSLEYLVLFIFAVSVTVLIGRSIDAAPEQSIAKPLLMWVGISLNLLLLFYYKYTNFALATYASIASKEVQLKDIALPLGISFFTFKSISYLIDIYKKRAAVTGSPLHDALYLSFFAQIQSGPLSRYSDMSPAKAAKPDLALFSSGVYRFLVGFSKKVLIANVLSNITTEVFQTPFESFSTSFAWLGSICYSLQLFFDFSGYSDMAIGITEMFGYRCPENFNYPYITDSVAGFWRRWHITLSEWFRDYIYIPLGGSRGKKKSRVYFNLLVVWLLTGIWHGAAWNFVAWGLGYFIAISLERFFDLPGRIKSKAGKAVYRVIILLFINFEWVLFNSPDLYSGMRFIKRMLLPHANGLADMRTLFLLKEYAPFLAAALLLSVPILPRIERWLESRQSRTLYIIIYRAVLAIAIVFSFIWSISFVVAGQNNPFAYANF